MGSAVVRPSGAEVVDTEQVSAAADAVVSRGTCMISVRVPTAMPKLAAAPKATSEVVQPRRPDSGCTDLLAWTRYSGCWGVRNGNDRWKSSGPIVTLAQIQICYRQYYQ